MSAVSSLLSEEEPRPGSCLSEKDDDQEVPRTHEASWQRSRNRPEPTGFGSSVANFLSLPIPHKSPLSEASTNPFRDCYPCAGYLRISVLKKSAHDRFTSSCSWPSLNQRGGVKTVSFLIVKRISEGASTKMRGERDCADTCLLFCEQMTQVASTGKRTDPEFERGRPGGILIGKPSATPLLRFAAEPQVSMGVSARVPHWAQEPSYTRTLG